MFEYVEPDGYGYNLMAKGMNLLLLNSLGFNRKIV